MINEGYRRPLKFIKILMITSLTMILIDSYANLVNQHFKICHPRNEIITLNLKDYSEQSIINRLGFSKAFEKKILDRKSVV